MKYLGWGHRIVCVILILVFLTGCSAPSVKLRFSFNRYERITRGNIPSNIQLTIYYSTEYFLTNTPMSVEALKLHPVTEKIVVSAEELAPYWAEFAKLKPSVLRLAQEESGINARLYYVLETSTSQRLLEVVTCYSSNFFVNNIEVEYNSLLFELIWPFLSEDAHALYTR